MTSCGSKMFTKEVSPIAKYNWLTLLVFLYFLTLSAEQLNLWVDLFRIKINHVVAIILTLVLACAGKLRLPDRRLVLVFLALLVSIELSSFCSPLVYRSSTYGLVALFTFLVYFMVPFNLMRIFGGQQLLKLYLLSFVPIGVHAVSQFCLSFFGVIDPFVKQIIFHKVARGNSWALEPSFYALYAIPLVTFCNVFYLLSKREERHKHWFMALVTLNLFLLASTATSALFSYIVFFGVYSFFGFLDCSKTYFPHLFAHFWRFKLGVISAFVIAGIAFEELFSQTFFKFFSLGFAALASFSDRWLGIQSAWNTFCAHPLFGVGLGGMGPYNYLQAHFGSIEIPLYDPSMHGIQPFEPTNILTEVLASLGMVGLAVILVLTALFVRVFVQALRDPDIAPIDRKIIFALFISAIVMVLCLQINQGLFRNHVWVHIALGLGYAMGVRRLPQPKSFRGEKGFSMRFPPPRR